MQRRILKRLFTLSLLLTCLVVPVKEVSAAAYEAVYNEQPDKTGRYAVNITAGQTDTELPEGVCDRNGLRQAEFVWDPDIEVRVSKKVYGSAAEQNYWRNFGNDYYYSQLSEGERKIWDSLEESCVALAIGTDDAKAAAVQFDNAGINLSKEELKNFLYIFKFANPQYYFLDSRFGWYQSGSEITASIYLYEGFQKGDARWNATSAFCEKLDPWLKQVAAAGREEEKVKLAHDIVISNTDYNTGVYDQSAYSMVCQGQTVCAGYSAVMQILLNANGITTIEVTSIDHAWNVVCVHGSWYAVDATYDDQYDIYYRYYMKSNATIQKDSTNHFPEAIWDGKLPELKYDAVLSMGSTYDSPYFTEGDYVYFKVNDNVDLAERYAVAVESAKGAGLSEAPRQVTHDGKQYKVLNSAGSGSGTGTGENQGNGIPDADYNGLIPIGDAWYCVADGKVVSDYTGLWYDEKVGWWYVENGTINFDYNGLVPLGDVWWCVAGGRVAFDYTGLWYDQNVGWWYVENGAINFGCNGLIPFGDAWWCVAGGRVAFEYTGLWYDPYVGWWYVENGTINFGYNGLIPLGDAWWCVAGGRVAFEYTGLWYDPYVGWWYVENGMLHFGYTGSVFWNGSSYHVVNGQVV